MIRRGRRDHDTRDDLERWLLTYADLITLLLAFFVVMYSMSQVDAKKFGQVKQALNTVLRGGNGVLRLEEQDPAKTGHGVLKLGDLRTIQAQIQKKFEEFGRQEELQTEITERGLVVHIMESALFNIGSADLVPKAEAALDLVYEQIKSTPNHIRVEGHTDDRRIATPRFASNWELSAARATTVVRYFIENHSMPPDRLSALGYGEYRPIRPNTSIENRAKNRRVDVVVLTVDMSLKEPSSQLYEYVANQ